MKLRTMTTRGGLWVLCPMMVVLLLPAGCAENQEQTQQTNQPVDTDIPTDQTNRQLAATDGPVATWNATTNPHGRGLWGKYGYRDVTEEGETADFPPEFFATATPDTLRVYLEAKMPGRLDYSIHGNTVTQSVSGTMSGTQDNSPSASPTASPTTTGTTTGGAQQQEQTPTVSTAVDIPIAAGPGSSATGGQPQAGAAGPGGTQTGGATSQTPTATGSNTNAATPGDNSVADGILAFLRANSISRVKLAAAVNNDVSPSALGPMEFFMWDQMEKDPALKFQVLRLLEDESDGEGS